MACGQDGHGSVSSCGLLGSWAESHFLSMVVQGDWNDFLQRENKAREEDNTHYVTSSPQKGRDLGWVVWCETSGFSGYFKAKLSAWEVDKTQMRKNKVSQM